MEQPGASEIITISSSDEEDDKDIQKLLDKYEDGEILDKDENGEKSEDERENHWKVIRDGEMDAEFKELNIKPQKSIKRRIESDEEEDDIVCLDRRDSKDSSDSDNEACDDDENKFGDSDIEAWMNDDDEFDDGIPSKEVKKPSTFEDKMTRFTLIHDLAVYATVDQAVGPSIKCCDELENPFFDSSAERSVRVIMENRRKGKQENKSDEDLIDKIYQKGTFKDQLAPWADSGAAAECNKLMHDLFPLATGDGELEAFLHPHQTYPDIWLNGGFDVGLRRPKKAKGPLLPGKISSIYGNVRRLSTPDEPFFSTFTKSTEPSFSGGILPMGSYAMMGPIQLVNHSVNGANAEFIEDIGGRVVLHVIKPVQPGQEVLVNYGETFEEFLQNSQNWPANIPLP